MKVDISKIEFEERYIDTDGNIALYFIAPKELVSDKFPKQSIQPYRSYIMHTIRISIIALQRSHLLQTAQTMNGHLSILKRMILDNLFQNLLRKIQ